MKSHDIRTMTSEEIQTRLHDVEEELFNLRFQFSIGQLENHNRLTELRRDVARMKTILRERNLAEQVG
jgi:large subunit ribosomal protein L29